MKPTKQTLKRSGALSLTALALAMACGSAAAATVNDPDTPFTANVLVRTDNTCGVDVTQAESNTFAQTLHINQGDETAAYESGTGAASDDGMLTTVKATGANCTLNRMIVTLSEAGAPLADGVDYKWKSAAGSARYILPKGGALDSIGQVSSIHMYNAAKEDISDKFTWNTSDATTLSKTDIPWNRTLNSSFYGTLQNIALPPAPDVAVMQGYTKSNIPGQSEAVGGTRLSIGYNTDGVKSARIDTADATAVATSATIGLGFLTSAQPLNKEGVKDTSAVTDGDKLELNYVLTVVPA